jgi:hypothetical protein
MSTDAATDTEAIETESLAKSGEVSKAAGFLGTLRGPTAYSPSDSTSLV